MRHYTQNKQTSIIQTHMELFATSRDEPRVKTKTAQLCT